MVSVVACLRKMTRLGIKDFFPARTGMRANLVLLFASLGLGALVSIKLGQDANWDLLNYHLYNGFAFIQGRFAQDLLAAGMQGSLNPALDALYAGLALGPLRHAPRTLAAVTGLWYGMAVFLAIRLAILLYLKTAAENRTGLAALAAAICAIALSVSGSAMVSQVGTTTDEVQVAVVMIAGLLVLAGGAVIKPAEVNPYRPSRRRVAVAGLLFGFAAGLKLTAALYTPAALLAAMSFEHPPHLMRRWVVTAIPFLVASFIGLIISDGWWALILYRRFGSPTFPMFNGLFRSPMFPAANVVDRRFIPTDLAQWLLYPWFWAYKETAAVAEMPLRDGRFALALSLGVACLLISIARRLPSPFGRKKRLDNLEHPITPNQRALIIFLFAGYIIWLTTSSILRYAVVLEVVAGMVVPGLLNALFRGRTLLGLLVFVPVVIITTTVYPKTFRIPYGKWTVNAEPQATLERIVPGTLVVLTFRGPVSYLIPMLPHQSAVTVINVGDTILEARGWKLYDLMVRMIRQHTGPIIIITQGDPEGKFPELAEVGLSPNLSNCDRITSVLLPKSMSETYICAAQRVGIPKLPNLFWPQAATYYRTLVQIDDGSQNLIGASYLKAVGSAAHGTRFIDWTDLLWSGVGSRHDTLPSRLDARTLYIVPPRLAPAAEILRDPDKDVLSSVDGFLILAPNIRACAACRSLLTPLNLETFMPALSVGEVLRFDEKGASTYLISGWWLAEPTGIWSTGRAEMVVLVDPIVPPVATLLLSGTAFTGPSLPSQRVRVHVVGAPKQELDQSLAGAGSVAVVFQKNWLRRDNMGHYLLHFWLEFPDAASPFSLGMSVDPRRLGFALADIRLLGK